jgi:hypothetical protein
VIPDEVKPEFRTSEQGIPFVGMIAAGTAWGIAAIGIVLWWIWKGVH